MRKEKTAKHGYVLAGVIKSGVQMPVE